MKSYVLILAGLLLGACEVFDIHPYDGKIKGKKNLNEANIQQIETATQGANQIRFAVISDTQRWLDELHDEVKSINARDDIDFVIHCGDLVDYGITKEFDWQQEVLLKLNVPLVVLLGNHDCLGSGKDVFRKMYGPENFSFVAGHVRFICLDTNALEYDFSNPVPDLNFLRSFIGMNDVEATVVAMHTKPFDDEFDNNVADPFHYYITQMPNPLFGLCGHCHKSAAFDLFNDGFMYYQAACGKNREYYIF
ncbi:MAG: metallophosphoesterase family protein, partial [Bacteroidaceae bacterium]